MRELTCTFHAFTGLEQYDSDDDDLSSNKCYMLDWKPEDGTRMHVIDRATGEVHVVDLPVFHTWCASSSLPSANT